MAAFFRLWQIGSIPPGLFGDEATDGLDALDVLAGRGAIFFPANFGREGLHMWLVAGMFRLMGVTPLALRLPSALAGIATALATYWLGRELVAAMGRRTGTGRQTPDSSFRLWSYVPLIAALYIATSYWHVHFSRFGIRGVFTPLLGALAFAAFWHAVNRANQRISESANQASQQISRSANGKLQIAATNPQSAIRNTQYVWFALSGLFLGLATHFYTASRFYPFFLGGFLILQAVIAYATGRREQAILRRNFWGIVVLFVVAALIFAPLGLYFVQHPGSFMQRASEVAATKAANPWLRMGQAAAANVLQFFVPGRRPGAVLQPAAPRRVRSADRAPGADRDRRAAVALAPARGAFPAGMVSGAAPALLPGDRSLAHPAARAGSDSRSVFLPGGGAAVRGGAAGEGPEWERG